MDAGVLARTLRLDLALRLAHALGCPTLLLKPQRDDQVPVPAGGFRRPLVALDGTRLAEASLRPALELCDPRQRHLTLCRVITPLAPGLRERRRRALAYLLRISGRLEERGVPVDVRVLARAHAAGAVTAYADLIGRISWPSRRTSGARLVEPRSAAWPTRPSGGGARRS